MPVHVIRSMEKVGQPGTPTKPGTSTKPGTQSKPKPLTADEIVQQKERQKEKARARLASVAGLSGRPGPAKSSRFLNASSLLDAANKRAAKSGSLVCPLLWKYLSVIAMCVIL